MALTALAVGSSFAAVEDYTVFGQYESRISDRVAVEGDVGSNGYIHVGVESAIDGSIIGAGGAFLAERSSVTGDIAIASNLNQQNGVEVSGTVAEFQNVEALTIPTMNVQTGNEEIWVNSDAPVVLAPGQYGKLNIRGKGQISFAAGEYTFQELSTEPDAIITFTETAGATIAVNGKIRIGDRSTIKAEGIAATDIIFYAQGEIEIGTDCDLKGRFVSPNGSIRVAPRTIITGQLHGARVSIEPDAVIKAPTEPILLVVDNVEQDGIYYVSGSELLSVNNRLVAINGTINATALNYTLKMVVNGNQEDVVINGLSVAVPVSSLIAGINIIRLIAIDDQGNEFATSEEFIITTPNLIPDALDVTLSWLTNYDDVDLWVYGVDADGNSIGSCGYSRRTWNYNGIAIGQLDRDVTTGYGPEHFWLQNGAPVGTYTIKVHYYADHGPVGPAPYTVKVRFNGVTTEYTGTLNGSHTEWHDIAVINIENEVVHIED
jgi:uncharacterized protein YfaP (DUF2135 family)